MTISIDPSSSNRNVTLQIHDLTAKHAKAVRNALFEIGSETQTFAKQFVINPPKTGRLYVNNKKRPKKHRASAAGESPANWTGKLVRNIISIVTGHSKVEIGVTVLYGKFLEEGTEIKGGKPKWSEAGRSGGSMRNAERGGMLPRPYLIRAVNKMKTRSIAILERHLKEQLK
jgi:hypothetical protein